MLLAGISAEMADEKSAQAKTEADVQLQENGSTNNLDSEYLDGLVNEHLKGKVSINSQNQDSCICTANMHIFDRSCPIYRLLLHEGLLPSTQSRTGCS